MRNSVPAAWSDKRVAEFFWQPGQVHHWREFEAALTVNSVGGWSVYRRTRKSCACDGLAGNITRKKIKLRASFTASLCFRKRAENRLSDGGCIQAAPLRKEYHDSDLRLFRWRVADEEAVRLLRVARNGRAGLSSDIHSIHPGSMRHAKGDGAFEPFENGRVNAEVVLAYAQRQLTVGFEQLEWRDRDAR